MVGPEAARPEAGWKDLLLSGHLPRFPLLFFAAFVPLALLGNLAAWRLTRQSRGQQRHLEAA